MSWGERSCYWLHEQKKPCNPTRSTCNVDCPLYQPNGKKPDSKSRKTLVDWIEQKRKKVKNEQTPADLGNHHLSAGVVGNEMIRVFPRKTTATPTDDKVYFSGPPLYDLPDRTVSVSCTFTYDKQQAEFLANEWSQKNYSVSIGGPAYDDFGGEFVPGRFIKPGYVITSRGCNNRCWFCSVWKREGMIRELPIRDGYNLIDSNLLQCSESHIRAVFDMLKRQTQKARFTGGLESKRLQDWHVDLLVDLKPHNFYFAYDTPDDYEPLVIAAKKIREAGFSRVKASCYCLIGYPKDTFAKAEIRLKQIIDLGLTPMAMLFRNEKGNMNQDWKKFQRIWARPYLIFGGKTHEEAMLF